MSISYSNGAQTAAGQIIKKIKEVRKKFFEKKDYTETDAFEEIESEAQKIYNQGRDGYY